MLDRYAYIAWYQYTISVTVSNKLPIRYPNCDTSEISVVVGYHKIGESLYTQIFYLGQYLYGSSMIPVQHWWWHTHLKEFSQAMQM